MLSSGANSLGFDGCGVFEYVVAFNFRQCLFGSARDSSALTCVGLRARAATASVDFEEFNQVLAQRIVVLMLHHGLAIARARERNGHDVADLGGRTVGHA